MVQGPMQTRKWQDKNGNDRYTTEITIREMKMLDTGIERSDTRGGEVESTGEVPF